MWLYQTEPETAPIFYQKHKYTQTAYSQADFSLIVFSPVLIGAV